MSSTSHPWLRPGRPRTTFPPYELGDPDIVGRTQATTDRLSRIYHKGHEHAWDGREVLDELIARHGSIAFPADKKAAFSRIASVLLWGELAAWSISADLAQRLDDPPAKMAASSQVFDEARHFYVLREYLWRAEVPIVPLGGLSRHLLVDLLETDNLMHKVVGMQLLVEATAVVMFREIARSRLEPVLTDLLYYFERDEARHVGLGVLALPEVLQQLSSREALSLWWFQTRLHLTMMASGITVHDAFSELGIDPSELNEHGFRYQHEILRRIKTGPDAASSEPPSIDTPSMRGLFRVSRSGQARLREIMFPTQPPRGWRRALLATIVGGAHTLDRWMSRHASGPRGRST